MGSGKVPTWVQVLPGLSQIVHAGIDLFRRGGQAAGGALDHEPVDRRLLQIGFGAGRRRRLGVSGRDWSRGRTGASARLWRCRWLRRGSRSDGCGGGHIGPAPPSLVQCEQNPEEGEQGDDDQHPAVVIGQLNFLAAQLEPQAASELIGKAGDLVRGGLLEELLHRTLPVEKHLRVGKEIGERVRQSRRIAHARFAERFHFAPETSLGFVAGCDQIEVHLLGQSRNVPRELLVA